MLSVADFAAPDFAAPGVAAPDVPVVDVALPEAAAPDVPVPDALAAGTGTIFPQCGHFMVVAAAEALPAGPLPATAAADGSLMISEVLVACASAAIGNARESAVVASILRTV